MQVQMQLIVSKENTLHETIPNDNHLHNVSQFQKYLLIFLSRSVDNEY